MEYAAIKYAVMAMMFNSMGEVVYEKTVYTNNRPVCTSAVAPVTRLLVDSAEDFKASVVRVACVREDGAELAALRIEMAR